MKRTHSTSQSLGVEFFVIALVLKSELVSGMTLSLIKVNLFVFWLNCLFLLIKINSFKILGFLSVVNFVKNRVLNQKFLILCCRIVFSVLLVTLEVKGVLGLIFLGFFFFCFFCVFTLISLSRDLLYAKLIEFSMKSRLPVPHVLELPHGHLGYQIKLVLIVLLPHYNRV